MIEDEVILLAYIVTKEDLFTSKFPYRKVFQANWEKNFTGSRVYKEFREAIHELIDFKKELTIDEINKLIVLKRQELLEKYPDKLEKVGYYGKKLLVQAFFDGKSSLCREFIVPEEEGIKLKDKLDSLRGGKEDRKEYIKSRRAFYNSLR